MMRQGLNGASAAVFDLDGTLIDSAPDIAAAVNKVMAKLGRGGLAVEYVESFIGDGSHSMLSRIFDDNDIPCSPDQLDGLLQDYQGFYADEPATRTRFFPNVKDDLETLHAAGLKLGICTNKPHALTVMVLKALKIDHLFDCVLGADAVENRKPHKQHLLSVLDGLCVAPDEAIYVGDTDVDLSCAKAAGVRFLLVNWGGGRFFDDADHKRLSRLADILPLAKETDGGIR